MCSPRISAYSKMVSNDSGFDALVKHLKGKKMFVTRSTCIADIHVLNAPRRT